MPKQIIKPPIRFDQRDRRRKTGVHRWMQQALEKLPTANIVETQLPLGDVTWEGYQGQKHMAEIKTVPDLINSMKEDHLQDQIARMLALNEESKEYYLMLIIIGQYGADANGYFAFSEHDWAVPDLKEDGFISYARDQRQLTPKPLWKSGYRPYAYVESYLSSVAEKGIIIKTCAPDQFGNLFGTIYNRSQKTRHHTSARGVTSVVAREVQALMCLSESIRYDAAVKLIHHFGSFIEVVTCGADELVQVDGIGPKSAKQIYENVRKAF